MRRAAAVTEAVVIGGGLAGGAIATMLAQAGRRVHLLEREREPVDKMCGEFLSSETQQTLKRLGLDLDRLGAATITTLRLASGRQSIEARLPFTARGLTRKRIDAELLDRAAEAGAKVDRGVAVRSITGGQVETTGGSLSPTVLVLATGKHEVRGTPRDTEGCDTGYVGFKTYWRLSKRARATLQGSIEVILFDGGYAGLQMVEGEVANLCLLIDKAALASLGGTWAALFDHLLHEPAFLAALGDAEPLLPKPLTIAGVPYGFLHRDPAPADLFRLGDQAAVIPSFCGEGMAIALRTATVAAGIISKGGSAADHHRRLQQEFAGRLRLAMRLQRWGQRDWSRRMLWLTLRVAPPLAAHLAKLTRVRQ